MPAGRHKSRSLRRVFKKTPGGKTVMRYEKRKPSKARCAGCGSLLKGTLRERPYKMRTIAKTKKRPERPFGGVLCSRCMRKNIIEVARK